jgi:hypothetical protein
MQFNDKGKYGAGEQKVGKGLRYHGRLACGVKKNRIRKTQNPPAHPRKLALEYAFARQGRKYRRSYHTEKGNRKPKW